MAPREPAQGQSQARRPFQVKQNSAERPTCRSAIHRITGQSSPASFQRFSCVSLCAAWIAALGLCSAAGRKTFAHDAYAAYFAFSTSASASAIRPGSCVVSF